MTDTELLIRECLTSYAEQAELVDLVPAAKARSREIAMQRSQPEPSAARWRRRISRARENRMSGRWQVKQYLVAGATVVIVLVALAFAIGGGGNSNQESGGSGSTGGLAVVQGAPARATGNGLGVAHGPASVPGYAGSGLGLAGSAGSVSGNSPTRAAPAPLAPPGSRAAKGSSTGASTAQSATTSGLTATRVVKTGNLSLTVKKGLVQSTITSLVRLTTGLGGYVSQSRTDNVVGSPAGEVTLRMPVNNFDQTVTAAAKLGHETSLTTNAHDVTGKFVDLKARLAALNRTRSTYLTILSRARTIGQTLSVQQRVDQIQQEIEQLKGELKVLNNQSADGTLTVDVSQVGTPVATPANHKSSGIGKAWHTSINRFSRGFDSIVAALGPLVLALLILALVIGIARLGMRGMRRTTPAESVTGGTAGK